MSVARRVFDRLWPIARRTLDSFNLRQGSVVAGYFAYTALLALFPFLIFASALTGFVIGPEGRDATLDFLFQSVPDHVAQTLEPAVDSIVGERRSGVLTFSAIGALWAASNGLEAIRLGLDDAYAVDTRRRYAMNRLYLFMMLVIFLVGFVVLSALIIFAPLVIHLVETALRVQAPALTGLARYAVAILVLVGLIWAMHRILPSRAMSGVRIWPGILTSTVLWILVATGMSLYLSQAPDYSITYGTLAGVIVTLLFFYVTGAALLLGGHVNAVVNGLDRGAATGPDENAS